MGGWDEIPSEEFKPDHGNEGKPRASVLRGFSLVGLRPGAPFFYYSLGV
jgi:hypothetical protein